MIKYKYQSKNNTIFFSAVFLHREKSLKVTLERFIMNKTYKNSIYPNGDGDRDRDMYVLVITIYAN